MMLALQVRVFLPRGVLRHGAFLTLAAVVLAAPAAAEEHPKGRIVGTVTVVGTNEPVAGATVSALTGQDGTGIRYAQAEAITDARGRYVLELPMGHAQLSGVVPPTGYWSGWEGHEAVATTPGAPEQTKHYQVQRGNVWRVRIEADDEVNPLLPDVSVYGQQFTVEPYVSTQARVDESGGALLTLPEIGGEYNLAFYHKDFKLYSKKPAKLSIEPGFQPERVVSATPTVGTAALVFEDEAGRKATLSDGAGAIVDGRVEIGLRAAAPAADDTFAVTGRVVNRDEQPLVNALVALGSQHPSGAGAMTGLSARTDETGRFTIANVPKPDEGDQMLLMVNREGFAGTDTRPKPVPEDAAENGLDFGTIQLSPGHQARLRVLDPDGKPVLGAWVEPTGSYSARAGFTRTDAEGRCTLRDLAPGVQQAGVRFGRMYATADFVVTAGEPDEATVRLAPPPEQPAVTTEPGKPLAAGEELPDWEVVAWTDGRERKLSDFRGKVVVIDVWGIWCSSCVYGIPGLQEVQERFRDEDVVFLSIHTAGTDLGQVRKLMELKNWDWPTGLDAGQDLMSGKTVERYRIRAFATTLVVGRDGRLVFSTDDETMRDPEAGMKEMERTAKELGIAWPFPEEMTPEEAVALMNRILAHRLSGAIEAALKSE